MLVQMDFVVGVGLLHIDDPRTLHAVSFLSAYTLGNVGSDGAIRFGEPST